MSQEGAPALSVVVPCFNEAASVRRFEADLLPALSWLGLPYELIAVDDGSIDDTLSELRALAERRPEVVVLAHSPNRGMGAALRAGFSAARGTWIASLDADLTWAPRQLRALLDKQKETGADLVGGSPFLPGGAMEGVPLSRRLPSVLLNAFYRGFLSPVLTAYTPIFRLYRAAALKALPLSADGFEINAEAAARMLKAGQKVAEVPAVLTVRSEGASKLARWRELRRHAALIGRLIIGR